MKIVCGDFEWHKTLNAINLPKEIQKHYCEVKSLEHLYKGCNSVLYLLNNDKRVKISSNYGIENYLMDNLCSMKSVHISRALALFNLTDDIECGISEYIPGKILDDYSLWNETLLSNLAEFLKELITYDSLALHVFTVEENYQLFIQRLEKFLDIFETEKDILKKLADTYKELYADEPRVLTHYDLHHYNIITDEELTKIISVIDFAGCCYNDAVCNLRLFDYEKAIQLAKNMGWTNDRRFYVGYLFHVIFRKLEEMDVSNGLPKDYPISIIKETVSLLRNIV